RARSSARPPPRSTPAAALRWKAVPAALLAAPRTAKNTASTIMGPPCPACPASPARYAGPAPAPTRPGAGPGGVSERASAPGRPGGGARCAPRSGGAQRHLQGLRGLGVASEQLGADRGRCPRLLRRPPAVAAEQLRQRVAGRRVGGEQRQAAGAGRAAR